MAPFCDEKNIPFLYIHCIGETFTLMDNDMYIRKSRTIELPHLHIIFAHARTFMQSTGNPNQWVNDYPSPPTDTRRHQ